MGGMAGGQTQGRREGFPAARTRALSSVLAGMNAQAVKRAQHG